MDQVFKTGITVFLIFAFLYMGVGIISASIDSAAAEQYTSDAAIQIESYNFSDSIINSCIQNAADKGYTMTITKIDSDGDGHTDMAEIITRYDFSLMINNLATDQHIVRAYAR